MEPKNQVDEFFEKLPTEDKEQADIFDKTEEPAKEPVKKVEEVDPETVPESIKNRQHRRLEQKLQTEREANIELNARLKALSEMDRFAKEVGDEVNPDVAKLFDASDAGKENALRLSKVIADSQKRAKLEAIEEIKREQQEALKEEKAYENFIDSQLELVEDTYNTDLTSNSPKANKARREFIELIEKLSPKDEHGDIKEYADFQSTYELYQKSVEEKPQNTRRQEIASRSMQRSNSGSETIKKRSTGFDGWKRDLESGNI